MSDNKTIILGAGLAGLSAAMHLDHEYEVYDKESEPGGLARSVKVGDFTFDYAPHILFTKDPYTGSLIQELLKDNLETKSRESYIYHKDYDVYTRFPFQANLFGLPNNIILDCLKGLLQAKNNKDNGAPANYQEWMYRVFGKGITDHLMVPYAEKIWTMSPTKMNYEWVDQRVPEPDFETVLEGALTNMSELIGIHGEFWVIKSGGIEALPKALAGRVQNIRLNMNVSNIDTESRTIRFNHGVETEYQRIISSLPLPVLINLMDDVPGDIREAAAALECNSIICVNLGIDRPNISTHHWDYFYEEGFIFHRLSFPMNFSRATVPEGTSSICCEVAYSKHRPLPVKGKENIVKQTVNDLIKAKILRPEDSVIVSDVLSIKYAYVIYDLDHRENVGRIQDYVNSRGIYSCGRFGEWEYLNMDHSMMSGQRCAEKVNRLAEKPEA